MTVPIAEARDLEVAFAGRRRWLGGAPASSVRAVAGVDLSIGRGETVALVGESGSGKSTLGRAILRTVPISAGHVYFDGRELTHLKPRDLHPIRARMQTVFQDPFASLNPRMAIGATVAEPLHVHTRLDTRTVRARVAEQLQRVGLDPSLVRRRPNALSGGQRQRVAIARATILAPDLVIADEPLSALDVSLQLQVLRLFDDLRRSLGLAYLFISHDLPRVFGFADRVAVMYLGRIVEIGPAAEVVRRPAHPYTRALIEAAPIPDPAAEAERPDAKLASEPADPADPPAGCRFHPRCPLVMPVCREVEPLSLEVAPRHEAACHLHGALPS